MTTPTPKKQKHYINNGDFLKALIDYKEASKKAKKQNKPLPPIPNYIGECFMKIAEGLSHKPNFINYPHREDMIGDGIENCLMYFENFDPSKSKNPFAYFTQVIYFAFLRRIQKEKKQLYVKYKSTEMVGLLDEHDMLEFEDELKNLNQRQTWDLVDLPNGHSTIGSRFVLCIKRDTEGRPVRYKARLVAQGFTQRHGSVYRRQI